MNSCVLHEQKGHMKRRRHVLLVIKLFVPVKFSFKLERADIVAIHSHVLFVLSVIRRVSFTVHCNTTKLESCTSNES